MQNEIFELVNGNVAVLIRLDFLFKRFIKLFLCREFLSDSSVHSYRFLFNTFNYVLRHLLLIKHDIIVFINRLWHRPIAQLRQSLRSHRSSRRRKLFDLRRLKHLQINVQILAIRKYQIRILLLREFLFCLIIRWLGALDEDLGLVEGDSNSNCTRLFENVLGVNKSFFTRVISIKYFVNGITISILVPEGSPCVLDSEEVYFIV